VSEPPSQGDRRRDERRSDDVRLADFTIPELRKALVTAALLLVIFLLFAYMVREVVVGVVAGAVLGAYLIPFYEWLRRHLRSARVAALLAITVVTVPLVAILVYSWLEISDAASYLDANRVAVAERMTESLQHLPLTRGVAVQDDLARWVAAAANQSGKVVGKLRNVLDIVVISISVFLFTIYYILTEHAALGDYVRRRIPGRYRALAGEISHNARAVVYGALYATFLTQLMKSAVLLAMNLIWKVPLAIVLSIISFFIGFFPIVGSWTVYLPVSIYLIVFRGDVVGGLTMLTTGFFGITLFMSMYLRPKIAAEKSNVLHFYWMFIALVTGVYTFGLVGIIVGPVLIGVLKAVFEAVTGEVGVEGEGAAEEGAALPVPEAR
jgi:predicted PurR-regulated permease PerM